MIIIAFYVILLLVYFASPKHVQLVLFIANILIPDPIPYVDEVIMGLALLGTSE